MLVFNFRGTRSAMSTIHVRMMLAWVDLSEEVEDDLGAVGRPGRTSGDEILEIRQPHHVRAIGIACIHISLGPPDWRRRQCAFRLAESGARLIAGCRNQLDLRSLGMQQVSAPNVVVAGSNGVGQAVATGGHCQRSAHPEPNGRSRTEPSAVVSSLSVSSTSPVWECEKINFLLSPVHADPSRNPENALITRGATPAEVAMDRAKSPDVGKHS